MSIVVVMPPIGLPGYWHGRYSVDVYRAGKLIASFFGRSIELATVNATAEFPTLIMATE